MDKVKVLVVDDSAFMRQVIKDILESDGRIQVVDTARNGMECLEKLKKHIPDVITMDVEMPKLDGLSTLKEIMKGNPIPVVMVSSLTQEGADQTIEAIQLGAVDYVAKPSGQISLDLKNISSEIIQKVLAASNTKQKLKKLKEISNPDVTQVKAPPKATVTSKGNQIIAIGSSTGGPRALSYVLANLPKLNCPVFIVQHMPETFTKSLATRLDHISSYKVKEAVNGEKVMNNTVYIAPGGFHMQVKERDKALYIQLDQEPPRRNHRPSVDVLLESLSSLRNYKCSVTILTGMGSDGTEGVIQMKKKGNTHVIVESEETCIVYGMPKSVVQANCADEILNLENIPGAIEKNVSG